MARTPTAASPFTRLKGRILGLFIVFEGGEGAGKSTQARILHRRLSLEGYQVVPTHEPGGTALGEAVRRWLKTRPGLTPTTELMLFTAARAQLVETVISPALNSGRIVICDRFIASTVAYQGYGRGLDLELINRLNEAATHDLRPDLTVFLDVGVESGLARKEGSERDTFESETLEFHRRVKEGYLALASSEPEGWLVIDGTLKEDIVASRIREGIQQLLVGRSADLSDRRAGTR